MMHITLMCVFTNVFLHVVILGNLGALRNGRPHIAIASHLASRLARIACDQYRTVRYGQSTPRIHRAAFQATLNRCTHASCWLYDASRSYLPHCSYAYCSRSYLPAYTLIPSRASLCRVCGTCLINVDKNKECHPIAYVYRPKWNPKDTLPVGSKNR